MNNRRKCVLNKLEYIEKTWGQYISSEPLLLEHIKQLVLEFQPNEF